MRTVICSAVIGLQSPRIQSYIFTENWSVAEWKDRIGVTATESHELLFSRAFDFGSA